MDSIAILGASREHAHETVAYGVHFTGIEATYRPWRQRGDQGLYINKITNAVFLSDMPIIAYQRPITQQP